MADAPDSKSGGVNPREGSSPSSGTNYIPSRLLLRKPFSNTLRSCVSEEKTKTRVQDALTVEPFTKKLNSDSAVATCLGNRGGTILES
jgi:hypothetical protein